MAEEWGWKPTENGPRQGIRNCRTWHPWVHFLEMGHAGHVRPLHATVFLQSVSFHNSSHYFRKFWALLEGNFKGENQPELTMLMMPQNQLQKQSQRKGKIQREIEVKHRLELRNLEISCMHHNYPFQSLALAPIAPQAHFYTPPNCWNNLATKPPQIDLRTPKL